MDERESIERYEFGGCVVRFPWGWWWVFWEGVWFGDRRNKQEVVTAPLEPVESLETGVSTHRPNCVGSPSGWEGGQEKVDSLSSLMGKGMT